MIRTAGGILIAAVCVCCGFYAADALKRRRDFLSDFAASLSAMETEISFGRTHMGKVFTRLERQYGGHGFYAECAAEMSEKGLARAWEEAAEAAAPASGLTERDVSVIKLLGGELGKSDVPGQTRALRHAMSETERLCRDAEERYGRLARVYRGCGALAGAAAVLLTL